MTCDFVGHPVAAEPQATPAEIAAIRAELGIAPDQRLLIVLPGSRRGEVTRLAPVFAEVVRRLRAADPALAVVLPAAAPVAGPRCAAHFPDTPILDPRGLAEGRGRGPQARASSPPPTRRSPPPAPSASSSPPPARPW